MDDEVTCPYCDKEFEVDTADGTHYNDGESASDYCPNCDKQVMIYSSCSWYRSASKADCLNGISEHNWSGWHSHHPTDNYTKFFATRNCIDCGEREQGKLDVTDSEEDQRRIKMYKEVEAKHNGKN
jgi:hypothetical protein